MKDNTNDLIYIKDLTSEEITEKYVSMREAKKDIEAGMVVISDELIERIKAMKINGARFGRWNVKIGKRTIITSDISLSTAKELGAVVIKIDKEKIERLIKRGIKVKGVKYGREILYVTDPEKQKGGEK